MANPDEFEPDFSDVTSGSSSSADAPKDQATTRTYTVVGGDSLSKIAKKILGDGARWKEIFEANRDTIKNPDMIHPGQVLKIPGA